MAQISTSAALLFPQEERVVRLMEVNDTNNVPHQEKDYNDDGEEEALDDIQYTKLLRNTDVDESGKLLISRKFVEEFIMPHLEYYHMETLKVLKGHIRLDVYDVDDGSTHQLTLRRWKNRTYVLMSNWEQDFVRRRYLAAFDTIGLAWDATTSTLLFSVLE
ncbi:hypothetical protein LIER_38207 [Lithospermum erythrorhizon]|uniref:B3 domain-containing protein n=1 Tax=Lithospermum erythrorhizon TaxID=34254 RepID=A0AAV3Q0B4_LITER